MSVKDAVAPELRAQAAKDLRAGAEHIGRVGWIQGRLADNSKADDMTAWPVCAAGSLNYAVYGEPFGFLPDEMTVEQWDALDDRVQEATRALGVQVGTNEYNVPKWNDEAGRSKAEVVSAMFAAAAALEAAE